MPDKERNSAKSWIVTVPAEKPTTPSRCHVSAANPNIVRAPFKSDR
jgi:hypothetical protein